MIPFLIQSQYKSTLSAQLLALATEFSQYKESAEARIEGLTSSSKLTSEAHAKAESDMQASYALLNQQMLALAKEYTEYKNMSEKAVDEFHERSLLVKIEHEDLLAQNIQLKASAKNYQDLYQPIKIERDGLLVWREAAINKEAEFVAAYTLLQEKLLQAQKDHREALNLQGSTSASEKLAQQKMTKMQQQIDAHTKVQALSGTKEAELTKEYQKLQDDMLSLQKEHANTVEALKQASAGALGETEVGWLANSTGQVEKLKEIAAFNKDAFKDMLAWKELALVREKDLKDSNGLLRDQINMLLQQQQRGSAGGSNKDRGSPSSKKKVRINTGEPGSGGSEVGSVVSHHGSSVFSVPAEAAYGVLGSATSAAAAFLTLGGGGTSTTDNKGPSKSSLRSSDKVHNHQA